MEVLKIKNKFVLLNNWGDVVGKPTSTLHMVIGESLGHFYLGGPDNARKQFNQFKKCKCGDNIYLFDVSHLSKDTLNLFYNRDSLTLVEYMLSNDVNIPIKCSKDLPEELKVIKVREDYFVVELGKKQYQLEKLVVGFDTYDRITGIKGVIGDGSESINVSRFSNSGISSFIRTGIRQLLYCDSEPSLQTV